MTLAELPPQGARPGANSGVNPPPDAPDIWSIFRALRDARSQFGLRANHMQTLQAMLSFLKPGHGQTVFASNFEICRRIGGIDERTLRRHIDRFVDLGFVARQDSPNRKRYRVMSSDGKSISFGLSLAPLLERAAEFVALAQAAENVRRDSFFIRKQILARLAQLEEFDSENPLPSEARKALRRKMPIAEYRELLSQIDAGLEPMSTVVDAPATIVLPASDGQTARHLSKSKQGRIDLETSGKSGEAEVQTLTSICSEAVSFASNPMRTWDDVERHARTLAPMMGIRPTVFEQAATTIGRQKACAAIFILLQLGRQIRDFGAYFHSVTLGKRQLQFDPALALARIARTNSAPI